MRATYQTHTRGRDTAECGASGPSHAPQTCPHDTPTWPRGAATPPPRQELVSPAKQHTSTPTRGPRPPHHTASSPDAPFPIPSRWLVGYSASVNAWRPSSICARSAIWSDEPRCTPFALFHRADGRRAPPPGCGPLPPPPGGGRPEASAAASVRRDDSAASVRFASVRCDDSALAWLISAQRSSGSARTSCIACRAETTATLEWPMSEISSLETSLTPASSRDDTGAFSSALSSE
eukprot:2835228-Prymnesium_polylepis.1